MRSVLRELALRVLLVVAVTSVVAGALVSWIIFELRGGPFDATRTPLWLLILVVMSGSALVIAVTGPAVRSLADRIIVLHQGELVADGDPAEVMASRVVQEAYLGGAGT